jgi:hypothetical protein
MVRLKEKVQFPFPHSEKEQAAPGTGFARRNESREILDVAFVQGRSTMPATHTVDLVSLCRELFENPEMRSVIVVWYPSGALEPVVRSVASRADLESEVDLLRGVIEGAVFVTCVLQLPHPVTPEGFATEFAQLHPDFTWPLVPGGWHPSLITPVDHGQTSSRAICATAFEYV